jgi:nitric oxide reductase NorE protein
VFGIAFAVTKSIEYMMIVKAGSNLATNQFLMYYFTITGIHFLHVIVGLCALTVCFQKLKTAGRVKQNIPFLESAASFWHIVDILWLFIFPLLYLMH